MDTPESSGQRFRGSPLWRVTTDNSCTADLYSLLPPPVAVPDIFLSFQKPSSAVDRCHSLSSLLLPPAALASLPARYRHIVIYLRSCIVASRHWQDVHCRSIISVYKTISIRIFPAALLPNRSAAMPSSFYSKRDTHGTKNNSLFIWRNDFRAY